MVSITSRTRWVKSLQNRGNAFQVITYRCSPVNGIILNVYSSRSLGLNNWYWVLNLNGYKDYNIGNFIISNEPLTFRKAKQRAKAAFILFFAIQLANPKIRTCLK